MHEVINNFHLTNKCKRVNQLIDLPFIISKCVFTDSNFFKRYHKTNVCIYVRMYVQHICNAFLNQRFPKQHIQNKTFYPLSIITDFRNRSFQQDSTFHLFTRKQKSESHQQRPEVPVRRVSRGENEPHFTIVPCLPPNLTILCIFPSTNYTK